MLCAMGLRRRPSGRTAGATPPSVEQVQVCDPSCGGTAMCALSACRCDCHRPADVERARALLNAAGPPARVTALAIASALGFVAAIAADMLPQVEAHGEEDHGTVIDLREMHGVLLLVAWGLMIPAHVVLLLYYYWVRRVCADGVRCAALIATCFPVRARVHLCDPVPCIVVRYPTLQTDKTICKFLHVHPSWKMLYRLHFVGMIVYAVGFAVVLIAIEDDGGHELEAVEWHRESHKIGGYAVAAVGLVQEVVPKLFESIPWLRVFHRINGWVLFVYVFGIQLWTGFILVGWPGLPLVLWLVWQGVLVLVCVALFAASRLCPRQPAETFEQQISEKLRRAGLEIVNPFHVHTAGKDGDHSSDDSDSSDDSSDDDDRASAKAVDVELTSVVPRRHRGSGRGRV